VFVTFVPGHPSVGEGHTASETDISHISPKRLQALRSCTVPTTGEHMLSDQLKWKGRGWVQGEGQGLHSIGAWVSTRLLIASATHLHHERSQALLEGAPELLGPDAPKADGQSQGLADVRLNDLCEHMRPCLGLTIALLRKTHVTRGCSISPARRRTKGGLVLPAVSRRLPIW